MRETLEHLLSKNSLEKDVGLQSMMDLQQRLPITALLEHEEFKSSHPEATEQDVIDCLLSIPTVQMDVARRTVHRPLLQAARCTLILHSIPPNVTADQICGLFKTPVSVKPDVNNTWFVTFTSEQLCLDAAFNLQSFSGPTPWVTEGPIACCVKTVTPLRRPTAPPSPYLSAQYDTYMGQDCLDSFSLQDPTPWEIETTPSQSFPSPRLGWRHGGARSSTVSCQDYQNQSLCDEPVFPNSTYLHEFRKFDRADIIAICKQMTTIRKPPSLEAYSKGRVPFGEFEGVETDVPEFILDEPIREWTTARRPSEVSRDERDRRKSPHGSRRNEHGSKRNEHGSKRNGHGSRRKSGPKTFGACGTPVLRAQMPPEYVPQSYSYTPSRKSTKSNDTNGSRAKSDGGLSWTKKMRDSLAKVEPGA